MCLKIYINLNICIHLTYIAIYRYPYNMLWYKMQIKHSVYWFQRKRKMNL